MKRCAAILLCVSFAMSSTGQALAVADPYASARGALVRAIRARLMTAEGGVWSWVVAGAQEDPAVAGTGHDQTAESTGLLLSYAAAARDWKLFALARNFYSKRLRSRSGLAYWKVDARNRPAANPDRSYSSAPIDELRIAKVFAASGVSGGPTTAAAQARPLLSAVNHGIVSDDVSWTSPGSRNAGSLVDVQYLDVAAMRRLGGLVPAWRSVATSSLNAMKAAVGSGRAPRTLFDFSRYTCDGGACETTPGLWVALHLLDQRQTALAYRIYSYYTRTIRTYGHLADSFSSTGAPSSGEDLSSYALLARLALRLGYRSYAQSIVNNFLMPVRVTSGANAGLFSVDAGDAPSFDNLEILLTLLEFAGRRPLAD